MKNKLFKIIDFTISCILLLMFFNTPISSGDLDETTYEPIVKSSFNCGIKCILLYKY